MRQFPERDILRSRTTQNKSALEKHTMMKKIALLLSALLVAVMAQDANVCLVLSADDYSSLLEARARNCTAGDEKAECVIDYAEFPASKNLEADCANSKS